MNLIKYGNKLVGKNGILVGYLPAFTIRLKFTLNVTPSFSKGTGVQVSTSPNIWDLTYNNTDWYELLNGQAYLLEVIGGNTAGVTGMSRLFHGCTNLTSVHLFDTSTVTSMIWMFYGCSSLTSVPLFDTSSVTAIYNMFHDCTALTTVPLFDTSSVTVTDMMFYGCSSLTSVPLFDTSSVTSMDGMFYDCTNVQSGALALYQQASSQATPPTYHNNTFTNCGSNTTTGRAELEQIPEDWGGSLMPVNFNEDD